MSAFTIPSFDSTIDFLSRTRNTAAEPVLSFGLRSSVARIRDLSFAALLERNSDGAWRGLLDSWQQLSDPQVEELRLHRSSLVTACLSALKSNDRFLQRSIFGAIDRLDLIELGVNLVDVSENVGHPLFDDAVRALLQLTYRWGQRVRNGSDQPSLREPLLNRLHDSSMWFTKHRVYENVDAFLSLLSWEDTMLHSILNETGTPLSILVKRRMRRSHCLGVIDLLAGMLGRKTTPLSYLEILAQRTDTQVAKSLAYRQTDLHSATLAKQLRNNPTFECLNPKRISAPEFTDEQRERLWFLCGVSQSDKGSILNCAIRASELNTSTAKITAGWILRQCETVPTTVLAATIGTDEGYSTTNPLHQSRAAVEDEDVEILDLGIRKPIMKIADWSQSDSKPLRDAAKSLFRDFTVDNLLAKTTIWPNNQLVGLSRIIKRIDPDYTLQVLKYLQSPSPRRRRSALLAIGYLGWHESYGDIVGSLLRDPYDDIRVTAVEAFAKSGRSDVVETLSAVSNDISSRVQESARYFLSLGEFERKLLPMHNWLLPDFPEVNIELPDY